MQRTLLELIREQRHEPSSEGVDFVRNLEVSIAEDLWESAGGYWSTDSQTTFRKQAMQDLAKTVKGPTTEDYKDAWLEIIRDFHKSNWGEKRLSKKERKEQTKESKIFWELLPYIVVFLNASIVMKFIVLYFGIRGADEAAEPTHPAYLVAAIAASFGSLFWFAYRRFNKE